MKELNALSTRFNENQNWLNYRSAQICACLYNTVRDPKKRKPWVPEDFMPTKERKQMTDKQMFAQVQSNNAALGGRVEEV